MRYDHAMKKRATDLSLSQLAELGRSAAREGAERDLAAGATIVGTARRSGGSSDVMLLAHITPQRRLELVRERLLGAGGVDIAPKGKLPTGHGNKTR
jgi:hypothetical protein